MSITKVFIERSIVNGRRLSLGAADLSKDIRLLSQLASDGLLSPGSCGLPRLVFYDKDLEKTSLTSTESKPLFYPQCMTGKIHATLICNYI